MFRRENIAKFVLILTIIICGTKCDSVYQGKRVINDTIIHTSEHFMSPFLFIRSEDIAFPKYNEEHGNIICAIDIIDHEQNGAYAEIDYGGVGYDFANIHLTSALWSGYNFTVQIYVNSENDELFVSEDRNMVQNMDGTIYQSVKKYECYSNIGQNSTLLLYGTNSWSFPVQDVNLTLQYPKENHQHETDSIITGVRVILYLNGSNSRGHITRGGMMQSNITLSFIISSTPRLAYQFWLYGIRNQHRKS